MLKWNQCRMKNPKNQKMVNYQKSQHSYFTAKKKKKKTTSSCIIITISNVVLSFWFFNYFFTLFSEKKSWNRHQFAKSVQVQKILNVAQH